MTSRRRLMMQAVNRYHVDRNGEITDDWDTIIANINAGNEKDLYKVGSYKPIEIDGITYRAELAGFAVDVDNNSNPVSTSWIFVELSAQAKECIKSSGIQSGGTQYEYSFDFASKFFNQIPNPVYKNIKSAKKINYRASTNGSGGCSVNSSLTVSRWLWVPSTTELESGVYSIGTINPDSLIKKIAGTDTVSKWPTCTLGYNGADDVGRLDQTGEDGLINSAVTAGGYMHQCFGFCI